MVHRSLPLLSALLFAVCPMFACGLDRTSPQDVAVLVGGVGIDPASESMVVVLEEQNGQRTLPIWIGTAEAQSIALEIEKQELPRPNTHDLAKRLLTQLKGSVERVVVTELRDGTYFAILVVESLGRRFEIDARPSDAIAIGLRVKAPLFVRETLFQEVRRYGESLESARAEELSL